MGLEGLNLGDRYRIIRLLKKGGMAEVYEGQDTRIINQVVAIKVVHIKTPPQPEQNKPDKNKQKQNKPDETELAWREIVTIKTLHHPHILQLYDFGEETYQGEKLIYMVMPYHPDGSFENWLAQRGNFVLAANDVAYFLDQAADALQCAHSHNIVHRDVKPANFLISPKNYMSESALPYLWLADFGIARFTATTTTATLPIGTPPYMPPEQWAGYPQPASDQYALAIMAYQLLTNNLPFPGNGMEMFRYQHINKKPLPPSTFNSNISPAIDYVILRALAKRPEQRFLSVLDFARAFHEALNYHPDPPPNWVKIIKKQLITLFLKLVDAFKALSPLVRNALIAGLALFVVAAGLLTYTVTNNPNAYPAYLPDHGTLALSDQLSDNTKGYGWSGLTGCSFTGGAYHVSVEDLPKAGGYYGGNYNVCPANTSNYSNFAFQVTMTITKGDCGGIIFRADTTNNLLYRFAICQENVKNSACPSVNYILSRTTNTSSSTIWCDSSPVLKSGLNQTNTLTVVAVSNSIFLYVNGQQIDQATDNHYNSGKIGVFAESYKHPTEVIFTDAQVWTL